MHVLPPPLRQQLEHFQEEEEEKQPATTEAPTPPTDSDSTTKVCVHEYSFGYKTCDEAWSQGGFTCTALEELYLLDCEGCQCPGDSDGK